MPAKRRYLVCSVKDCSEKHYGRGMCRKHWRRWSGEGKRRYQKVKNDPERLKKTKAAIKRYRESDEYRERRKVSDRKYYEKNKKKILAYKKQWTEENRFNGSREEILKRFNNRCQVCRKKEDLVIHHIDNNGRATQKPNNHEDNLTILCRACHMIHHLHTSLL